MARDAPLERLEVDGSAQVVLAKQVGQGAPLCIGLDAQRDPGGVLCRPVHTLRRSVRAAVAHPLKVATVGVVLEDNLAGRGQRDVDHRHLDELAFAGPSAVIQGRNYGEGGVRTSDGVERAVRRKRLPSA